MKNPKPIESLKTFNSSSCSFLTKTEAELEAINNTIIRVEFSPSGEILNVNNQFEKAFNLIKSDIIGTQHNQLLLKDNCNNEVNELFWDNLLKGNSHKGTFRRKDLKNNEVWIQGTYIPIINNNNEVFKVILIGNNITATKQALKSIKEIKYALDQSSIIAITDKEGCITYVNDKFIDISKFSKEELVGSNHRLLNSGHHSKEFMKNLWDTISSGKIWKGEIKNKAKDNTYYWVDATIVPFLDSAGKPIQYIAIRSDITKKKEIELSLKKANKQAKISSKAKDAFLANMSHEIRTPLNAIIGFTSLLKEKSFDEESNKYVNAVSIASKNLLTLINDILDISKIEEGKIELEEKPLSLKKLAQEIITLNSHAAKAKNLKLISSIDHEIPEFILADPIRITQILVNLMGNAIKFTPKGQVELKIMAEHVDSTNAKISFSVKDSGIGIPEEKQQSIFERFTQAENSTTREYGGTGLGLNIVKMLVKLHKGEVKLKSKPNEGTEFTFNIEFPIIQPKEVEIENYTSKSIQSFPLDGLKILVAEDNTFNQILASTYITRNKGKLDIAENGEIAIKMIQENHYDCILMDLQMPKLDGFQATEIIRNELKISIPIIACTAHSLVGEKNKSLEIGMNDYITKPYLEPEIISKILKYTKNSALNNSVSKEDSAINDDFFAAITTLEKDMGSKTMEAMLEIYKTRTPKDIKDLKYALKQKDVTKLYEKAHFISGSLGTLCFINGYNLAKQIEIEVKEKDLNHIKPLVSKLITYLESSLKKNNFIKLDF